MTADELRALTQRLAQLEAEVERVLAAYELLKTEDLKVGDDLLLDGMKWLKAEHARLTAKLKTATQRIDALEALQGRVVNAAGDVRCSHCGFVENAICTRHDGQKGTQG